VIIDAVPYQINRTYSATTGWPATLQYPTSTSGYRLQLAYDYQNGYLKRVRNASSGTVYWEAVSADAAGRLQNETFGNGVQTYTEYDQANGWLFKRQAGVGGGTGLIDAQVSWDYNGNFTTRQDLKQGLTETFVYDAMNRLDYSQRNGVTNLDVTLDAIGNVTWKSDVGSYSYHATKRRAVVSAGSNSYGYDANGNMGECQKSCVRAGCIDQSLKTNRSPNWIANWALAACHAIGGRFQFSVMCRSASQINLVAA
jgi:hypothetical protein